MSRRLAIAAVALAAATTGGALSANAAAPVTLNGTVGPSATISLAKSGAKVRSLKPGAYKLVVNDRASVHNFHLFGPGVNVKTSVGGTGAKTFAITLKKGTYRYQCDPHAGFMNGSFSVS
jgi:plastocyanin